MLLSKQELARMRGLASEVVVNGNAREEKLAQLRLKSQEKKKHWPNTLEAIRDKNIDLSIENSFPFNIPDEIKRGMFSFD